MELTGWTVGQDLQNLLGENIGRGWHINCLSPKELRCAQGLGGDCFDCKKQKPVRTSLREKGWVGWKWVFQDAGVPVGYKAVGPFKGLEKRDEKPSENPVVGALSLSFVSASLLIFMSSFFLSLRLIFFLFFSLCTAFFCPITFQLYSSSFSHRGCTGWIESQFCIPRRENLMHLA